MFSIVSPAGGFGNHLRWLLLLDNQFSFELPEVLPGSVSLRNINTTPKVVLTTLDSKIEFINKYIYPSTRTWHNWLITEWYHRETLDSVIGLDHIAFLEKLNPNTKCVAMISNPKLAYKCYFKFNPALNNERVEDFYQDMINQNRHLYRNIKDNVLLVTSASLYNATLNKSIYDSVTQFFGLDNLYDRANEIHNLWFNLHQQSEQQFIKDVADFYLKEHI
jgi:hypothetical protein